MNPPLHQVTVVTSPEAEDAVAAALEELVGQIPSIWADASLGVSKVSIYHAEVRSELRKEIRELLKEVRDSGLDVHPAKIHIRKVPARDWSESWKRHFKPIVLPGGLVVLPTWSRRRIRKNDTVVRLDPGLSFGTGQHATTRYCLEQVAAWKPAPGKSAGFCDMGTGSGILAIAAAKLGYAPVHAFDFDPDCVRISRENAVLNKVERIVKPIRADVTKLPAKPRTRFELVAANLIYDLLISHRAAITSRVAPGGRLILAGILTTQFPAVSHAYSAAGWHCVHRKTQKEWTSGLFQKQTIVR